MNINISYLANYTFSIFKENVIYSSNQNQKIVLIALLALGCLAGTCLIVYCCLKGNMDSEEFENSKEENSKAPTQRIVSYLWRDITRLELAEIQVQSAKVFITLQFEHGEIKKEFIIKKSMKRLLDDSFMFKQARKIRQDIEKEIEEGFGDWNELQMMAFFKDTANNFHNISQEVKYFDSDELPRSIIDHESSNIYIDRIPTVFAEKYQMVVDKMGFPKEKLIEDGEFVPGTFYQTLD